MVGTAILFISFFTTVAQAQPSLHEQSKLLGNPLSLLHESKAESVDGAATGKSGQKLSHETSVQVLGQKVNVMKLGMETTNSVIEKPPAAESGSTESGTPNEAPNGVTLNQHDLYIGGVRVWNGNVRFEKGTLYYSGGIAPTQIPVPLFVYPLGPVLLQVEAGVEFEGLAQAKVAFGPSVPIQDSVVQASLTVDLYAAAYLEAYARLLFLKGGIGGRINVIDASAGYSSTFYINGSKPLTNSYGYVTIFSGQIYGYVDFNLFFGRWSRLLYKNFFNFRGKSFNFYPKVDKIQW